MAQSAEYRRAYYLKNRERIKAENLKRYHDGGWVRQAEYWKENKERIAAQRKQKRAADKAAAKQATRKRAAENLKKAQQRLYGVHPDFQEMLDAKVREEVRRKELDWQWEREHGE